MTYATEKQIAFIVSLARAKGMTKTEALEDYGINPGETLTARLASEVIDSLKAPVADAPVASEKTFADYMTYIGQCRAAGVAIMGQDEWKAL